MTSANRGSRALPMMEWFADLADYYEDVPAWGSDDPRNRPVGA
jgi:hypothetical protein